MERLAVAILAAGQGLRMKSKLPKVLHPVAGLPMICHVLNNARHLSERKVVLVVGHGAEAVRETLGDQVEYAYQEQRLGTGHALLQARSALEGTSETVLSLYGDMPLLTPLTLEQLATTHSEQQPAITMLTVLSDDSMGFGRVVRDQKGEVQKIVEEVDCTPEQKRIKELNCGIYCFRASWLWPRLPNIPLSRKGEYYLTDMIEMAVREGLAVRAVILKDVREVIGINDRTQLAWAESILRDRVRVSWMRAGVTMIDPQTTYIDTSVKIGADTVIYPNSHLQGTTEVGEDCVIGPNTVLRDAWVGQGCRVAYSVVEGATLEEKMDVGPFAHLRSDTHPRRCLGES